MGKLGRFPTHVNYVLLVLYWHDNDSLHVYLIQTISSLTECQCDLAKLKTSLEAKNDRITKLEGTLLQTKEAAATEYQKLHEEKEQMKSVFMEKLKERESELIQPVKLYLIYVYLR